MTLWFVSSKFAISLTTNLLPCSSRTLVANLVVVEYVVLVVIYQSVCVCQVKLCFYGCKTLPCSSSCVILLEELMRPISPSTVSAGSTHATSSVAIDRRFFVMNSDGAFYYLFLPSPIFQFGTEKRKTARIRTPLLTNCHGDLDPLFRVGFPGCRRLRFAETAATQS